MSALLSSDFEQTSTETSLERGKKWLDFGDLGLIFKDMGALWTLPKKACLGPIYLSLNVTYNVLFWYLVFASMCYSLLLFYKELWEGHYVNKDEI